MQLSFIFLALSPIGKSSASDKGSQELVITFHKLIWLGAYDWQVLDAKDCSSFLRLPCNLPTGDC